MKYIRIHSNQIFKLTLGFFFSSWLLLVLAIPLQVFALGESHLIYFIYDADEGCYELVMDHHGDPGPDHITEDEEHKYHSFHSTCCYDDFSIKTRNEVDHQTDYSFVPQFLYTISFQSENKSFTSVENNLPPPKVSLDVIRVTCLLI